MSSRSTILQQLSRWLAPDGGGNIRKMLAGLRFVVVAGTTANTNIAIADADGTAITTAAIILGVFDPSTAARDYTDEASVPTAGNLQLSTTNTTGMVLTVVYIEP